MALQTWEKCSSGAPKRVHVMVADWPCTGTEFNGGHPQLLDKGDTISFPPFFF